MWATVRKSDTQVRVCDVGSAGDRPYFLNEVTNSLSFSDFSTPGGGGAAGQAAGSGSKVADIYSSIAANSPRADEQAILALNERSRQKQRVMAADEAVYSQEKLLNAQLEAKKLENAAIESVKQKEANGNMFGKVLGAGLSIATSFSDATYFSRSF